MVDEMPSEKLVFDEKGAVAKTYVPSPQFGLVDTLEIGKLHAERTDRRGVILRLHMKAIPNRELAVESGIYLCQLLAMLSHSYNTIHKAFEPGEQSNCWIDEDLPYLAGPVIYINDKYWGDREIDTAVDIALTLARRYKWTVLDKRESLLVQIAKAAAEGD